MSNQLLPCPFCNAAMSIESNRDWHRVVGEHDERCLFMDRETVTVPATDEQLTLAVRDWNRRANQPAAGEPVYQYMGLCHEWVECKQSFYEYQRNHGYKVRILYPAPPAAAHGDEAVRKDAEAAYVEMTCQSVLIDGATYYYLSSEKMQAFDRLFSVDVSDAMRAQGDSHD